MARRRRKRVPMLPFGRVLGPPLTIVMFIVTGYLAMTGRLTFLKDFLASQSTGTIDDSQPFEFATGAVLPGEGAGNGPPANTLSIASFNLKVFGVSKAEKTDTMKYLALILSQFDVVAVQEIVSKSQAPVDQLLDLINRTSGKQYQMVLSPRLGETKTYLEQYAFLWDTARVELAKDSAYLVNDSGDYMHREPFVASFSGIQTPTGSPPFTFTLINVHTDPDKTDGELNVLDDVFQSVRSYEYPEDDVIVLGDLNVEAKKFGELGALRGLESVIREATNTAGNRTIDHIVIDRYATTEFHKAGVINYERDLQLSREDADKISDHRPVYAVFDISEHAEQGILAAGPSTQSR